MLKTKSLPNPNLSEKSSLIEIRGSYSERIRLTGPQKHHGYAWTSLPAYSFLPLPHSVLVVRSFVHASFPQGLYVSRSNTCVGAFPLREVSLRVASSFTLRSCLTPLRRPTCSYRFSAALATFQTVPLFPCRATAGSFRGSVRLERSNSEFPDEFSSHLILPNMQACGRAFLHFYMFLWAVGNFPCSTCLMQLRKSPLPF